MCSKQLLLFACLMLLSGGLRLTSTTTTTTFVAAMSIANQDLERYFRSANATQAMSTVTEDRIAMDVYTYAFLNYSYIDDDKTIESDYKDEMARYGEGKILSVSGKLVHITDANDVSDDTACSSNIMGTLGDPTPAAGTAWIALVRRGLCTFEDKVRNVYAKGAKGVIVYNDKPVQILEKMQIKGKNRNITAVMTYQDVGLKMARIVDDRFDMICHITEGRSAMRPLNSLNRTSVLFVSISFIVLMVISLIWLIIYYIQRFRYLHTKEQQSRQLCNVTKKAIMKIPTKTGKSSDEKDLDSDCCAICIEAYKPSDCIRVLPCKHEFHKNCIDPWLIEHRTCPMCKLDVLKFYGYVFLGSEESILEYEPAERSGNNANLVTAAAAVATSNVLSRTQMMPTRAGQLADLMRSRDFVIDFPRVFVLEAGSVTGTRDAIFSSRLPERSQSSLSIANATDFMCQVANKLDRQHGLKRFGKTNVKDGMEQNLLPIESLKKRRSHSADGRYSNGYFARQQQQGTTAAVEHHSRRSSAALHTLTDASYAQSRRRQLEELQDMQTRQRTVNNRRDSVISLGELHSNEHQERRTSAVLRDVGITIQINGDDVDMA